jgi:glutaredoxin-like protein
MTLLNEKDREKMIIRFAGLDQPVKLIVFSQDFECQYCRETREIAEELAGLSSKISVTIYDFVADQEVAEAYQVDKIPAIAIIQDGQEPRDFGIRYYGVPAGYEFSSLIEDLVNVSGGESGLSKQTRDWAAGLSEPLHLQVFVTPTCPYCPQAVILAHQLAMESDYITADMVEATEFPHLSMKYQVMGVPRTVVNETVHVEGAAPEQMLVAKIEEALSTNS